MKRVFLCLILATANSCSTSRNDLKMLSNKQSMKKQLKALKNVRPLLRSDEFDFMNCRELGGIQVEYGAEFDSIHNQNFGTMDLRIIAVRRNANIMSLSYKLNGKRILYQAQLYQCKKIVEAVRVDKTGMCAASRELVVTLDYTDDEFRKVGEEILRQKAKYYAIENYYKTYSVKKITYSYTKKQFSANVSFYKCL